MDLHAIALEGRPVIGGLMWKHDPVSGVLTQDARIIVDLPMRLY